LQVCGETEVNLDFDRASDAEEKAAWKIARTPPTTAAGAAELLEYIAVGPITGLFELGETSWHETAFLLRSPRLHANRRRPLSIQANIYRSPPTVTKPALSQKGLTPRSTPQIVRRKENNRPAPQKMRTGLKGVDVNLNAGCA
jgi:hypothetical protein